ncbi:hypothetical protein CHUAL_002999 [Chamberlinius hualienensis]
MLTFIRCFDVLIGIVLCYVGYNTVQKIVFLLKYYISYLFQWINRQRTQRTIPFNYSTNDPGKFGLLCPKEAVIIELPRTLHDDIKAIDGVDFYGVHGSGVALRLRLMKRPQNKGDVWLHLRSADGITYQFPHQPDSTLRVTTNDRGFYAGGLLIEVLEPLRVWRIVYNGFLRMTDNESDKNNKTIAVHFDFIWRPLFNHVAIPDDLSISFKAKYLASQDWTQTIRDVDYCFEGERLEQFGQLRGTVEVKGQPSVEILTRGLKIRRHGVSEWEGFDNKISIQGVMDEGTVFHIFGQSSESCLKNFVYGYVQPSSNMVVYHMTESDFSAEKLLNFSKDLIDNFRVNIIAGDCRFSIQLRKRQAGNFVHEGSQWSTKVSFWEVDVAFIGTSIQGRGFVEIVVPNSDNGTKSVVRPWEFIPFVGQEEPDTSAINALVVDFDDVECLSSSLVGGKGSSLAKLVQFKRSGSEEFLVPSGLSLTKNAFEQFLKHNSEISSAVNQIQNVACKIASGDLETVCKNVVESIERLSVSDELRGELDQRLTKLFGNLCGQMRFAVRSSAVGVEDGEETSAAGQNETYLGVKGLDKICSSIVKCWASQFTYRSVEYKRQNGLLLNEGMGVVVQQMVPAEVAGVTFSRDPIDGNVSHVVITCNYGLGETVVSGVSDPDTIILNRTHKDELSIQEKRLGSKLVVIQMNEHDGTEERSVESLEMSKFSLSDEDALKLGQIAVTIEKYFDGPRDLEWAMSGGSVYLLQVRPITTGYEPSDFEIVHEYDSGIRTDDERFTTANVGEVMPGCTHTVTVTSVIRLFDICMQESLSWKSIAHRHDPVCVENLPMQCARTLLDCTQMKSWQMEEVKGNVTKAMEVGLYGRVLDDDDVTKKANHRYGHPPLRGKFNTLLHAIKGLSTREKYFDKVMADYWQLPKPTQGVTDAKIAHQNILQHTVAISSWFQQHLSFSIGSSLLNMILFNLLAGGSELTIEHYQDFGTLIGTCNGLESGNVPAFLEEIASVISKHKPNFTQLDVKEALRWIENDKGVCGQLYNKFLIRHGHRCRFEFDVGRVPWNMDQISLVKLLQNMVKFDVKGNSSVAKKQHENVFDHLHVKYTPFWRFVVTRIYSLCRSNISKRELSKSALVKLCDLLRKGYCDLGKLMMNEGLIPEERLVFFMSDWEISRLLEKRCTTTIRRAKHRRRLYQNMEDLVFPELFCGNFVPVDQSDKLTATNDSDISVKGYPVFKGTVSGRACVITSYQQCGEIQQGDILVTFSTDIAWSPYFPLLSGVVTEIGGLISHGAVVAREYGLPCLVGAAGATKAFKTGDWVALDSNQGIIKLIHH